MTATRDRTPAGLGRRGGRLWRKVLADFEVSVDSKELLTEACRALDILQRIAGELSAAPLVVPSSKGQDSPNRLLGEARLWMATAARLLGQLGLPTLDELESGVTPAKVRSAMARAAAHARWHR